MVYIFFFFKQKTAYEMRIRDWSSDVCSSDLKASFERHQEPVLAPMVAGFAGVAAGVVDHVVEEPVHGEFGDPGIVHRLLRSQRQIRIFARHEDRKSVV